MSRARGRYYSGAPWTHRLLGLLVCALCFQALSAPAWLVQSPHRRSAVQHWIQGKGWMEVDSA